VEIGPSKPYWGDGMGDTLQWFASLRSSPAARPSSSSRDARRRGPSHRRPWPCPRDGPQSISTDRPARRSHGRRAGRPRAATGVAVVALYTTREPSSAGSRHPLVDRSRTSTNAGRSPGLATGRHRLSPYETAARRRSLSTTSCSRRPTSSARIVTPAAPSRSAMNSQCRASTCSQVC
jgi:hypothetical protein